MTMMEEWKQQKNAYKNQFKRKISQRLSPKSLSKFDFSSNPFRSCSSIASKSNDYIIMMMIALMQMMMTILIMMMIHDDYDDYDDYKGLDLYNDCDINIECSTLS